MAAGCGKEELCFSVYQDFTEDFCNEIGEYMERAYRRMPAAVLHPADDLSVVLQDLADAGGRVVVAHRGDAAGAMAGVLLVAPVEAGWQIKECLADDEAVAEGLRKYAAAECASGQALCDEDFLVQLRVIRVFDALKLYARIHPETSLSLSVRGDVLSGHEEPVGYLIANGQCTRLEQPAPGAAEYEVAGLPELLFPQGGPYMHLMLN